MHDYAYVCLHYYACLPYVHGVFCAYLYNMCMYARATMNALVRALSGACVHVCKLETSSGMAIKSKHACD